MVGKIYMIEPINKTDEADIYIGSTMKEYLSQRLENHRRDYNNYKAGYCVSRLTSFKLFDKYGIDNCKIILIELVNVSSKDELHKREAYHIRNTKCINKCIPLRSKKQYYEDNKDKAKEYYQKNKERLSQKNICECGSTYATYHKTRHFKTIKHMNFLNNNNIV
jgi:hypothetical protein